MNIENESSDPEVNRSKLTQDKNSGIGKTGFDVMSELFHEREGSKSKHPLYIAPEMTAKSFDR